MVAFNFGGICQTNNRTEIKYLILILPLTLAFQRESLRYICICIESKWASSKTLQSQMCHPKQYWMYIYCRTCNLIHKYCHAVCIRIFNAMNLRFLTNFPVRFREVLWRVMAPNMNYKNRANAIQVGWAAFFLSISSSSFISVSIVISFYSFPFSTS